MLLKFRLTDAQYADVSRGGRVSELNPAIMAKAIRVRRDEYTRLGVSFDKSDTEEILKSLEAETLVESAE